eukprot:6529808-Pyramimonas_sp.AAC.1
MRGSCAALFRHWHSCGRVTSLEKGEVLRESEREPPTSTPSTLPHRICGVQSEAMRGYRGGIEGVIAHCPTGSAECAAQRRGHGVCVTLLYRHRALCVTLLYRHRALCVTLLCHRRALCVTL